MLDDDIYRAGETGTPGFPRGRGHPPCSRITVSRSITTGCPGLPGSTPARDLSLSRLLFADPRFRPDGLKIYPTMVVAGTELEKWFLDGRYRPYENDVMTGLIAAIKAEVPKYVRISRVLRDIPSKYIVGGLRTRCAMSSGNA